VKNWLFGTNCWQQDIRKQEYIFAFVKGIGMVVLLGYLFYDSWIGMLMLSPLLVFYFRNWLQKTSEKKERLFREQFKEGMQMMASALNVGYSVENAIRETKKDLERLYTKECRIIKEFQKIIHQLSINLSVEQALLDLTRRVKQEDVDNFVTVFSVAKRMGGESVEILKTTARTISEKIEVEKEIQMMLGAKEFEFKIMSFIPFGIILYMRLTFSDFMGVLYGNILGIGIMTACLMIYIFAFNLGRRLIAIEV
jgi:tight adherence protein B